MRLRETFENIVRFDERFQKLTPERQNLYTDVVALRHRGEPWFRSKTPKNELKAWDDFALDFVEGVPAGFSERYAQKPETFEKDRFEIVPCAVNNAHTYTPHSSYGTRGSFARVHNSVNRIFLDTPLGYAMTYKRKDGESEVISIIGFLPDTKRNVLVVDQIQGGDTYRYQQTREARSARMKFAITPEEILYKAVEDLARKSGMRGIAVRKAESSKYNLVREAGAQKTETPYKRVIKRAGMLTNLHSEYAIKSLKKPGNEQETQEN